jgi:hypothetical protein
MREPYREGVATRPGPESCGCVREGVPEALTGEPTGVALSREITTPGSRRRLEERKATPAGALVASVCGSRRGLRPTHAGKLRGRELGDPTIAHRGRWAARGRPKAGSP